MMEHLTQTKAPVRQYLIPLLFTVDSLIAPSQAYAFDVYFGLEAKKVNISEKFNVDRNTCVFNLNFLCHPVQEKNSSFSTGILRSYIGYDFIKSKSSRTSIELGHDLEAPTYLHMYQNESSWIIPYIPFVSLPTWYHYKMFDLNVTHHQYFIKGNNILSAFGKIGVQRTRLTTHSRYTQNNQILSDDMSGITPLLSVGLQFRPWNLFSIDFFADKKLKPLNKSTRFSTLLINNQLSLGGGITFHF